MEDEKISKFLEQISSDKTLARLLSGGAAISIAVLVIGLVPDFDVHSSIDRTAAGAFGDFVGGLLNPVLTFLTFIAVIVTVRLQRVELKESRKEFKRSADALAKENFEATFFRMSDMRRSVVNTIDEGTGNHVLTGTDLFELAAKQVAHSHNKNGPYKGNIVTSYERGIGRRSADFDHYFRIVWRIAGYINNARNNLASVNAAHNNIDYAFYAQLFRDQLSNGELDAIQIRLAYQANQSDIELFEELGFFNDYPGWLEPYLKDKLST
ncbi:MAG: putative phage abortive infection protein [Pseudomonadota bacterium]